MEAWTLLACCSAQQQLHRCLQPVPGPGHIGFVPPLLNGKVLEMSNN